MRTTTALLGGLGAACTLGIATLGASTASAADSLTPPAGLSQAAAAASSAAHGSLGQSFTTSKAEREGKNPNELLGGDTAASGGPVAVYTLAPTFVRSGTGPVGVFAYAASAYAINGTPATVDSVWTNGHWVAANIATGQDEQTYARQAGGGQLLFEPQVHAWYTVKGDSLTALNDSARKAVGGPSISVKNYAAQVHAKYAAMLPGSSYDASGKAGGFQDTPAAGTATGGGSSSHDGTNTAVRTGAVGAGGAALLGAGVVMRRRRQH